MNFTRQDIEVYLEGVRKAIFEGKYQIAPCPKNKELIQDYLISEQEELDIINSLTAMDFSNAVHNDHIGREYELLYIFGKDITLQKRFEDIKRTVSLYIKFNKISDRYLFVISFHEQERSLSYYFK